MGGLLLDQAISLDRPVSDDDGRRVVDFLEDTEASPPARTSRPRRSASRSAR
jgi:RNA polymerase primary sigma factor